MDKRLRQEIEAFEDIESYQELMDRPYTRALKKETVRRIASFDFNNKRILEIGAGITEFGEFYKQTKLACLTDINFKILNANKRQDGSLLVCDGQVLPFKKETFDYTIFIGVLHHFADQPQALGEAYRVMKEGGRIFMVEPHRLSINFLYYSLRRLIMKIFGSGFVKNLIGCFTPDESQLDVRAVKDIFKKNGEIQIKTILSFRLPPLKIFKKSSFDVKISKILDKFLPFNKMGTTIFIEAVKTK